MISVPLSKWWDWIIRKEENTTVLVLILLILLISLTWYKWMIKKSTKNKVPLPPGPRGLPIVGYLPFLNSNLHVCFANLAKTYGPIIKLQLGSKACIVLSSATVAKEVLKDNDIVFANRDVPAVAASPGAYGGVDIIWSPYGEHWRMLRKICVGGLLSTARLEFLYDLRRREVRDMVNQIYTNAGQPVDIGENSLLTFFHVITSMLWGGTDEKERRKRVSLEFREITEKYLILFGELNVSDLFPALAMFDLQGKERKLKRLHVWFDRMFDVVIDKKLKMEREGNWNTDIGKKDFLQVLLEFKDQEEHKTPFTITHIKSLFMDMMLAGTKTSSSAVEWVMAELMNHPKIMRKVQDELDHVVGVNSVVEESHVPKLNYLNAVLKEALRLYPVAPFLVPRSPSEPCIVGGYTVPKGAKVVLNAWAIHRDPDFWDNPLEFIPERFLDSGNGCDFAGTNFSYLPFGSGRRVCVGTPLAERMVPFLLASLLHSFNWKLPEGTKVDLSETLALELKKTIPLVVTPTPRLSESRLYT